MDGYNEYLKIIGYPHYEQHDEMLIEVEHKPTAIFAPKMSNLCDSTVFDKVIAARNPSHCWVAGIVFVV